MTQYVVFAGARIVVGYFSFRAGQTSKGSPSEEAMIQRLMKSRANQPWPAVSGAAAIS